mmetsp:Transcript_5813/g.16379  ORF Transcript_5813/g.16379 Transcript_5813/m.16379 type:complete len:147 (+) Transcript_5813:444-884(+)
MTVSGRSGIDVTSSGAEGPAGETISFTISITDYQNNYNDHKFLQGNTDSAGARDKICIEMVSVGNNSTFDDEVKSTLVVTIPMQQSSTAFHAYQDIVLGIVTVFATILLVVACKQRFKAPVHPEVSEDPKKMFDGQDNQSTATTSI